jgi:Icc-related predicted phosphoesterase
MRFLYTSDIHANRTHLFSMLEAAERERVDSLVIGGDLVPHGLPGMQGSGILQAQAAYLKDVLIPAIRDFRRKKDARVYLDLANDDFICSRSILEGHAADDDGLFHLLHMQKHGFTDSVDILGYMAVPPTPFGVKDWEKPDSKEHPYAPGNRITRRGYVSASGRLEGILLDLDSEDTIENDLDRLSETITGPFIFVAHSPPHDTPLDVLYSGGHVGSISIRRFVEKWSRSGELLGSFHGHIHESPARSGSTSTFLENAICVNPGQGSGPGAAFHYVICELTEAREGPSLVIDPDRTRRS